VLSIEPFTPNIHGLSTSCPYNSHCNVMMFSVIRHEVGNCVSRMTSVYFELVSNMNFCLLFDITSVKFTGGEGVVMKAGIGHRKDMAAILLSITSK